MLTQSLNHSCMTEQERCARVLMIDDDERARQTLRRVLAWDGISTLTAKTGAEGISLARGAPFDVILIGGHLSDMSGTDVITALRGSCDASFVLMGASITLRMAVDAMKLGASDVIEKPISPDVLLSVIDACTRRRATRDAAARAPNGPPVGAIVTPRSVVERWASYVIKVCEVDADGSAGDFKTLEEWARRVAVSCSTLCETCRLLGIRPLDARDFARVLCALRAGLHHGCAPEVLFNVSKRRILTKLAIKAGVDLESQPDAVTITGFLANQRFIPHDGEAMRLIRSFVSQGAFTSARALPSAAPICD